MHGAAALTPSHLYGLFLFFQYFSTELQPKPHQKLTERDPRRGTCLPPADRRNLTHTAAQTPGLSLAGQSPLSPSSVFTVIYSETGPAGHPLLPAAQRAGDCPQGSAGQPAGSPPAAGGGRGQRPAATSGVCRQVTRHPPARAAPPSPPGPAHATIAPPGRAPFPLHPSAPGSRQHAAPQPPPSQRALPAPCNATRPRTAAPTPGRGGRASYLSLGEAAGAAPGRPSPCGPGGPPVTPAAFLAAAPARPRPAPATP